MAADDLVMQGARASTTMILTKLNRNNSVPTWKGLNIASMKQDPQLEASNQWSEVRANSF